jgi:hypothetical protein
MIASLTQRLDLVDTLARWHHAEWAGFYPGWTIETCRAELMAHTDPNCMPAARYGESGVAPLIEQEPIKPAPTSTDSVNFTSRWTTP